MQSLGTKPGFAGLPTPWVFGLRAMKPQKRGKNQRKWYPFCESHDSNLSHMKKNRYNFILLLYWSCFVLISSYFKCLDSCKHWKGLKFTISTQSFSGKNLRFRWGGCFRKPLKKHRRSGIHGFKVSVTKVLNKKRRIPRAQAPFRRMDDGSGWYAK